MLLQCKDVGKSFGVKTVLSDVSFIIEEKEKAAIVGVNGAGKTTLFNIITNLMQPDSGQVIFSKESSMGCLKQLDGLNPGNTIYDEMLTVFEHLIKLENLLRQMESDMSALSGEALDSLMNQYSHVSHEFESKKGFEYKSRIRGVIKGLGFSEDESLQPISILSGGQKTRVALGKLLLSEPDILLLDEPTNHLDITSILWLEDFLRNYPGSVVIISHDRYFLDKIVTKIVEIENGKSVVYNGNFTKFVEAKSLMREIKMKTYQDQQRDIKRQEEVIKKLKSFNREKSIKRAESREKLLAKVPRVEKPENLPDTMRFILNPKRESGNDVLDVTDLSKTFDGQPLFSGISFQIKKGEKTALIGPNGIGKTTLIRIVLKSLQQDSGQVKEGANVTIGYYDQEHHNIDENKTIFQEISDSYPKLTVQEIRDALAAFVFTGDDIFKQIKTLSGGERGRVALAKIMLSKANFLILDEPTNHLDIYSKEILESTLKKYSGTALFISHDRYFINSVANKIIELTPVEATVYLGNYDYYLEKRALLPASKPGEVESSEISSSVSSSKEERLRKKESQAEERRIKSQLEKTEKEIESTEEALRELDEYSSRPEVYTDPVKARQAVEKRSELDEKLNRLYEEWDQLQEF